MLSAAVLAVVVVDWQVSLVVVQTRHFDGRQWLKPWEVPFARWLDCLVASSSRFSSATSCTGEVPGGGAAPTELLFSGARSACVFACRRNTARHEEGNKSLHE